MDAHATRLLVWDVPEAVERGAPLRFKVGVKCSEECGAVARRVSVRDAGRELAAVAMSDVPWPDTAALYFAEVELPAPSTEGVHVWEASVDDVQPATSNAAAHAAASQSFQIRVVPAPECVVKVAVVDRASRAPVCGARVVAQPYRAVTDAQGNAELRVPKGAYRIFVTSRGHLPFRCDGEVFADITIHVELPEGRGPSDAELWS